MIRLVVGDESDEIRVQVTIGHPQTVCYHSEPFGKTCRRDLSTSSSRVAQDRLHEERNCYPESRSSGTPQNDIQIPGFRMDSTIET